MAFLTCDTSNGVTSIVLCSDDGTQHMTIDEDKGTQAARLVEQLDGVLRAHNHAWASLDFMACCTGPGGFTAVRIGVATIRALALASGSCAIGVPLHDVLAYAGYLQGKQHVQTVYAAGRRDVVMATYHCDQSGVHVRQPMQCIRTAQFSPASDAVIVGLAHDDIACDISIDRTQVADVMASMLMAYGVGEYVTPTPLYARAPDAIAAAPFLKRG